jgi:hypothetical protein
VLTLLYKIYNVRQQKNPGWEQPGLELMGTFLIIPEGMPYGGFSNVQLKNTF